MLNSLIGDVLNERETSKKRLENKNKHENDEEIKLKYT